MDKNDIKRIILWIALIIGIIVTFISYLNFNKKVKEAGFDNKRDYKISLYVNKEMENDYKKILLLTDEPLEQTNILELLSESGYDSARISTTMRPTLLSFTMTNTNSKHESIIMCGCTFFDYIIYNQAKTESPEDFVELEDSIKLADIELSGFSHNRFIYIIGPKYEYNDSDTYEMTYEEYVKIVKKRLEAADVEYIDLSNYNAGTFNINDAKLEPFNDDITNAYYTGILNYMEKVNEKDRKELTEFYQENL